MIKIISTYILILVSFTSCNSVKKTDSITASVNKPQTYQEIKKYQPLKGVYVLLKVRNHANRHKYCELLTSRGMIVNCEKYKTITSMVDHNEVAVTCPKISMEITPLIISLLKMPNTKQLNLSDAPEYNNGKTCKKHTAIFVELFESNL